MPDEPSIAPRRVIVLTSPGLYGAAIINTLVQTPGLDVVGIGLTNRVFKGKGPLATLKRLFQRSGLCYTWHCVLVMNAAWIRLRLTGRPIGLRSLSKSNVRYLNDVNSADTRTWMASLSPDFVASFYFNQWIGQDVREIPRIGCVNMHPSLLPELRGPDPIFRTLEQGLERSGLTLHKVADEFDAGEILHQKRVDVPKNSSVLGVYFDFVQQGAQTLAEWLAGRISGGIEPASDSEGEYFGFPTTPEVREFRRKGQRLGGIRELHKALAQVK
jgi:methionyl-tRNA formyltransferase